MKQIQLSQATHTAQRAARAAVCWFAPVAMAHTAVSLTLGSLSTKKINPRGVSGGLPMEGIP